MEKKFFADSMLGKLARWLRLLGYDTLYHPSISDDKLIEEAKKEGRIILTLDLRLAGQMKENCFLLSSQDPYLQLREVLEKYNLDPWKGLFSRCVLCNLKVEKVKDKKEVEKEVPLYALNQSSLFYRCPSCGKVYWEGSHHQRIKNLLLSLMGKVPQNGKEEKD